MRSLLEFNRARARGAGQLVLVAALALLSGCGQSSIRVYSIPKEEPWKVPPGWKVREADGMRVARFSAPSTNGTELDVSVFPISAREFSGSTVEILNIWRQQLKLSPLTGSEAAGQLAEKVSVGPTEGELYDMTSADPDPGRPKLRTLVSASRDDQTLWFIKMTGDEAGVSQQKPVFLSFLKTVIFKNIPPATQSRRSREAHGPGDGHDHGTDSAPSAAPQPDWEIPTGWTALPPGDVLLAKFTAAGEGGAKADINISFSPGDGGGPLMNINRWRRQVGLPAWDEATLEKNVTMLDAVGAKALLVDLAGTDAQSGQSARSIGVIVPLAGRTWFYKMMGHPAVVEREKAAFLKFVSSAKHPGANSNG
jgi:hypothetical protein